MVIEGSPQALELAVGINLWKLESEKTVISMGMDLQNIWIEYSNDLVRNLAELGLAFSSMSKLSNYTIPASYDSV